MNRQQLQRMYHDIPEYQGYFPQEKVQQHTHNNLHTVTAYQRGYYNVMNVRNFVAIILPCIMFIVSLVLLCVAEWNGASTLFNVLVVVFSVISVIASSIALMFGIVRIVNCIYHTHITI